MKKYFLTLLFFFSIVPLFAQKNKADSLAILLAKEKTDSNQVTLLWNMANVCSVYNPDTALILSQKALYLAKKIKFKEGESMSLGIIANTFIKIGNYPRALEFYFQKLKFEEQQENPRNLAAVNINIGVVYGYQEEYRKALNYFFQSDSIIAVNHIDDLKYYTALNIGDIYNSLNINDSAFIFYERSLNLARQIEDGDFTGTSMVGLGHSYFKRGNDSLALKNYNDAMPYLHAANDEERVCEAAIGLAKLYDKQNLADSAEFYARQALELAKKDGFLSWHLDAAGFLSGHYKKIGRNDSALFYLETEQGLKDSINSKERIRASQVLSSNEQLRQTEMAEAKQKAREERSQQLQFLFIGIFIPGSFLFTLFLSRIRVHVRLIKLMGILSLLILFEYLTLWLHPYVLEVTHHTPVYEIMIFVAIAAILIPTHHRIEHWLIDRLTQRNRRYTNGQLTIKTFKFKTKKPSE